MTGDPRQILRGEGLRPKKSFGQSFLVAEGVARSIAAACVREAEIGCARVVEIGAGTGALTRLLVDRASSVVAIERDRDLVPVLERELSARARVVEADAQQVDLAELLGEARPGSPRVLCGNLPYSITGSLLRRTVEAAAHVDRAVFMIQDEVADRLTAQPGTKAWGAPSIFVGSAFDVRRVMRVSPGSFHPPPRVWSAVVELTARRPPRAVETPLFQRLVHAAFAARRKTLRNAWAKIAAATDVAAAAERAGVALGARGETLEVEDFARMAAALGDPAPDP